VLQALWQAEGVDAVRRQLAGAPAPAAGAEEGDGVRRVLVHPTGYRLSPYADVEPAGASGNRPGGDALVPERKLWHSSPGSVGR
jgi:error-prone DNA polymerase